MNSKVIKLLITFLFIISFFAGGFAQNVESDETIRNKIEAFKKDDRGPYRDIRWFCPDGTVVPPKERCPQRGGVQRARYKEEVLALQTNRHIFLGQILATTNFPDFWDAENNHSRLKQYQLEKYLRGIDNGWILRKAQFYRGSIQAEDEEAWGVGFFNWLLARDEAIEQNYFLIRQALKDIPHKGDNNQAQLMRSQSQTIAERYPPFMDLRVKIHGQPQISDIEKVRAFKSKHSGKLSEEILAKIDELVETMEHFFQPMDMNLLQKKISELSSSRLKSSLSDYVKRHSGNLSNRESLASSASMIFEIRQQLLEEKKPAARMVLLDISNDLEETVYKQASEWNPETLKELLDKIYNLSLAAAGAGYVERWEWKQVSQELVPLTDRLMNLDQLNRYLHFSRSQVEWGAGTVKATYQDVINTFSKFEPLAYGFLDDRIRSSVLLPLGDSISRLGDFIADQSGFSNRVMGIANQGRIRGLNPGYTLGELQVVTSNPEEVEVSGDKIYVFDRPPSDLKPVAGIATVTEGSLVSHVQLLARNLGIPNAIISDTNVEELKQFSGQKVFYAVSNQGTVIMKPESEMTAGEKTLFSVQQRREDKIVIPVDKIRVDQASVLNLRDIKASDSGVLAGPKAANLGQLKQMFPDNVVEGLVIPFGIFRDHMEQQMPGREVSYWQYLNEMFSNADRMRESGTPEAEVENYLLDRLEVLRETIKGMPLKPSFVQELETSFESILGKPLGKVPVFLRSDTNMEDLKEFTGAGLNLTLFNVLNRDRILQGIKDVWASPYNERSYKWRQKYLLNPENVYPSILVIPSVDVDYSGVLITKGISSGKPEDLTIAFSRGAGGAVDGQVAESYLVEPSGQTFLLAPAREPYYNRLPYGGGVERKIATFEQSILNEQNINNIMNLSETIKKVFPKTPGIESEGPYDIELGFKDNKIWLFQVRPFVENRKAMSSEYLESITPRIDGSKLIKLSTKL